MMKIVYALMIAGSLSSLAAAQDVPEDVDVPEEPVKPRVLVDWIFDDPRGDNALVTTTTVQGRELTRQTQYLKRFQGYDSQHADRTSMMMVARTQKDFDAIMKIAGNYVAPRKLDFDKELFIFVFAGKFPASWKTLVEVAEVDRNEGPIRKNGLVYDACLVRVSIDHSPPPYSGKGENSPWTMIRVNKETFFKEHPMTEDTKFVLFESRSFFRSEGEASVIR